jgi:Putative Ig domain
MLSTIIVNGSWYAGGPSGSPGTVTPPTITSPTSLPVGTINTAYANTQFIATGNTPITWSITSGTLPSGLTFNSSGLLFGTPTASATGNIQFTAANSVGSANVTLPLTVNSVATAPTVTTTTLPSASVGASYSFNLAATGTTPITWAVQSGILPNGLGLSSTGVISGTPTTQGTTSGLVFRATNSVGYADSTTMSLAVNAAGVGAPVITNYYMSAGLAGAPYSYTLGATGAPTITWTLVNGTLPPGLSLASNGVISGTPTSSAVSYGLIFRATNGSGTADTPSQDFAAAGTAITYPLYPPLAVVGTAYTPIQFTASGTTPITYSVASGSLPAGMSISSSGVLSGTPTSAVSGNLVSFQASNLFGSSSTKLKITASPSGSAPAVPTNYVTTALTATGSGTTYNCYTDADIDLVPWGALGAGDVVNIYWKSTPYARKWGMGRNIANTGTASNPIIVNGVTDASGNRPRFNFNGATTAKGSNPSLLPGWSLGTGFDLYDQTPSAIGYNLEDYAGILIRGFYQSSPAYIQIKNLEMYGTHGNSFVTLSGTTRNYYGDSGIRVQNGNDILIENCVISYCGWGVFTQTNGATILDTCQRFTMRKSFLTRNGVFNSGTEHNAYIQCTNPVIEGNYFGPLIDGSYGSSYKSRSSGEVFRYNWVETNARAIDLVEPEEQVSGIVGLYDQADYGIDHVYGNVIAVDEDQMKSQNGVYHPFHFGSDKNTYPAFDPVYLSTNTSIIERDNRWTGTAGSYAVFPAGSSINTTSTSGSFSVSSFPSGTLAVGLRIVVYGNNTGGSGLYAGTYLVSATNGTSTFTLTTTDGGAISTNVGTGNNTGLTFILALITAYNPSQNYGVWQAAISNTLTRAYYINPSTTPASLDNQPDNQQSCFVFWSPGVYGGSTVRKIFVQYSSSVPRDGYEAEINATQVILRRNGTTVGTYTHGLTGLTTTQIVLLGVELSPGASSSVDVKVRCSTVFDSKTGIGFTAPVCITYNDTSPLTGGYSGLLINDGGTASNVQCTAIQPSIGVHRYQFGSDGSSDIGEGGYRQAQGSSGSPSVTPPVYIGSTVNGTKINRRQLYFYNNSFICNTLENQVFFELNEKTATVDAWNNLFWVSCRGSTNYGAGWFKINERGGNYNFRNNSNIFYATSDATIRTSFPNDNSASSWTPSANYNITGRTLPSDLNNPITTDADPLLTAVGAPTYNYLPTATYVTTGGITSFPSGLPASFKSLAVQYQPGNRTNAMISRSTLNVIGALES